MISSMQYCQEVLDLIVCTLFLFFRGGSSQSDIKMKFWMLALVLFFDWKFCPAQSAQDLKMPIFQQ